MIMDSLDEYLETVAGYIFDNDKLVTYKWLSKELEVHVNVAKQILWEFRQRNKGEKNFDSTFLLMGTLKDGGMRVEVVKEKDLSAAKEEFTKVVSEHIYSLQKALPEIQVLGLAENGDVKYSAIKCIENNERSDEDMITLRWGIASKEMHCQEKTKLPEPAKEESEKSPKKKPNDAKKDNQKKGYDNLFGKVSNKQKSPSSSSSSSSNTKKMEVDTSNPKKQTSAKQTVSETSKKGIQKGTQRGGLSSFLQPSKNQEKSIKTVSVETSKSNNFVVTENTKKESTVESSNKQKENIVESSNIQKESTVESSNKQKKNTVESSNKQKKNTVESSNKQKKNARGKKRNRSKEANAATKKRKRITIQSDSSDTGSSDEEQEVEKEPSPSPEKVSPVRVRSPSPPKVKHEGGKCKVLKLVDKTFEEDGYLVTKKVHVYESCSEEEPEAAKPKKSVTPESRAETKGKKNTKQTTLMNFFKKS